MSSENNPRLLPGLHVNYILYIKFFKEKDNEKNTS